MKKRMLLVLVMSVSFTPLVFAAGDGFESSGAGQELAMQVPAPANSCPYSNYMKPEYPSHESGAQSQTGKKHDAGKI